VSEHATELLSKSSIFDTDQIKFVIKMSYLINRRRDSGCTKDSRTWPKFEQSPEYLSFSITKVHMEQVKYICFITSGDGKPQLKMCAVITGFPESRDASRGRTNRITIS
jgi:hypothetical protein